MERKNLQLTDEKLNEDLVVASYAVQEDLPLDMAFEGLQFDVYPPERFFNDEVHAPLDILYLGFTAGGYDSIPYGDIEAETKYLINNLYNFKNKYRKEMVSIGNDEAAGIVGEMSPDGYLEFVSNRHMDYLDQAIGEDRLGKINDLTMGRLVFWSKLENVTEAAVERLEPDMDSD